MYFKTIFYFFFTILVIKLCAVADAVAIESKQVNHTPRQSRFNNIFFDLLSPSGVICTGCPQRYCDTDPAIILGYCCGCRRRFDVLPVFCSPTLFCPASIRETCHDYEYLLHCCC